MSQSSRYVGWVTRSEAVEDGKHVITLKIYLDAQMPEGKRQSISMGAKNLLIALLKKRGVE